MEKSINNISFESTEETISYSAKGNFNSMVEMVIDCLVDMGEDSAKEIVEVMEISIEAYREEIKK